MLSATRNKCFRIKCSSSQACVLSALAYLPSHCAMRESAVDRTPTRLPCHLFVDWDGTLTKKSTLEGVATLCPECGRSKLKTLTKAYLKDLNHHMAIYTPKSEDRTTLEEEMAWLSSLVEVEKKSIERIEAVGLFHNIQWPADYRRSVDESVNLAIEEGLVQLRPGARELIEACLEHSSGVSRVDVLSVNWSRDWIRKILDKHRVNQIVGIASNDVDSKGSGRLSRTKEVRDGSYMTKFENGDEHIGNAGLWTAKHKLDIMKAMIRTRWNEQNNYTTCYIGDSATDLVCLMEADLGICIRDDPLTSEEKELKETLDRLNIKCSPIQEFEAHQQPGRSKRLFYTNRLDEVALIIPQIQEVLSCRK